EPRRAHRRAARLEAVLRPEPVAEGAAEIVLVDHVDDGDVCGLEDQVVLVLDIPQLEPGARALDRGRAGGMHRVELPDRMAGRPLVVVESAARTGCRRAGLR